MGIDRIHPRQLGARIDGRRLTPRCNSGLLAAGEITEAVLSFEELARAQRAWFINSLRDEVDLALPVPLGLAA